MSEEDIRAIVAGVYDEGGRGFEAALTKASADFAALGWRASDVAGGEAEGEPLLTTSSRRWWNGWRRWSSWRACRFSMR